MSEDDRKKTPNGREDKFAINLGLGAAFGVALGTVVFAVTGDAFWIAIGPAFGVAVAAAIRAARGDD